MRKVAALLLALLIPLAAYPQAVSFPIHKAAVDGFRNTNDNFSIIYDPTWFDGVTDGVEPPTSISLTRLEAYSLDLSTLCKIAAEAPAGTLSYSKTAGAYPGGTGLAGSIFSGTPTTVESQQITFRCTFTPDVGAATTDDWVVTFGVTSPDVTAPTVPANIIVAPSVANPSVELTATWSASTDGTGVASYTVASSDDEATCTASAQNTVVINSPTLTTTRTGLSPSNDYWFKIKATDTLGNVSAYSSCVQGTTSASASGGSGTALLVNNGFENYAVGTNLATALPDAIYNKSLIGNAASGAILEVVTTHAREGTRSMRSQLTRNNLLNARAEVTVKASQNIANCTTSPKMWVGFSVYLPSGGGTSNDTRVIFQTHTKSDTSGHSPVLGLRYKPTLFRMSREVGTNSSVTFATPAQNEWHDVQLEQLCRHDTTGYIHLWIDNVQVVDFNNLQTGWEGENFEAYLKFGDYDSGWDNAPFNGDANGTVHQQFHDSLRICYSNSCVRADVMPTGNRLAAP